MAESTPAFESVAIDKGWTLHHRQSDRFKTEYARVFVRAPLDEHQAERQLFAGLMGRGTQTLPSRRELQAKLHQLWGAGYGLGIHRVQDRQVMALRASTVSGRWLEGKPDNLGALLSLLGEAFEGPALGADGQPDPEVFEQERRELLIDLAGRSNNKRSWSMIRLREELFGKNHPLVRPMHGTEEELRAATPMGALERGMSTLLGGEADVYVIAPCTTKQAEKLVRQKLALGPRKKERLSPVELPAPRQRARSVREEDAIEQGRLGMAFRIPGWTGKEDRSLCVLADVILSGTFSSKLFRNVRERLSLCYEISSQFDPTHGVLYVSMGIESPNRDAAVAAVRKEVKDLVTGRITEDEVDVAKRTLLSSVEGVVDSPTGLIDFFYQRSLTKRREQSIDGIVRKIRRTDARLIPQVLDGLRLDTVYFLDCGEPAVRTVS